MKPFLAITGNIVKVMTLLFSKRIETYWLVKRNELVRAGLAEDVVDNHKTAFINCLYNFWFLGVQDPFIADLPEDLQAPETVDFVFEYDMLGVIQVNLAEPERYHYELSAQASIAPDTDDLYNALYAHQTGEDGPELGSDIENNQYS